MKRSFDGGEGAARTTNFLRARAPFGFLRYASALCADAAATLDDLREGVTTLEDLVPIVRRVFGGTHPTTAGIERALREARAALHARETPSI